MSCWQMNPHKLNHQALPNILLHEISH
jgi:hypothetical protein